MIDRDLLLAKAGAVERHLGRVELKSRVGLGDFLADIDRQESVLFNLQRAIQNCIDIAAHIISAQGLGVPGSTSEMFYLLQDYGFLDSSLVDKMVKAVGFRNLVVHEYVRTDMAQVHEIAVRARLDLNAFLAAIFMKTGLAA